MDAELFGFFVLLFWELFVGCCIVRQRDKLVLRSFLLLLFILLLLKRVRCLELLLLFGAFVGLLLRHFLDLRGSYLNIDSRAH